MDVSNEIIYLCNFQRSMIPPNLLFGIFTILKFRSTAPVHFLGVIGNYSQKCLSINSHIPGSSGPLWSIGTEGSSLNTTAHSCFGPRFIQTRRGRPPLITYPPRTSTKKHTWRKVSTFSNSKVPNSYSLGVKVF